MNSIAAIVVTYNRKELLHQCIAGLQAQTCGSFDIWIIDNASTDGTTSRCVTTAGKSAVRVNSGE